MKTIICGSGDVGYSIADKLSKEEDPEKQQIILKSINLLIDTISKLKK